jgi:uncharacterized membrane protein YagU involved in acid resistance
MMGIAQRVINSGARGAVAAMAMTGTRSLTGSLGLMSETPPEAVLHQQVPGLMAKIPKSKQPAVVELAHWTFGVVAGAGYAMLPSGLRKYRWAGAVYGLVVLTGFEVGIAPLLGLSQSRHLRLVERLVFLADHALFGVVLAPPRHEQA